MLTKFKKIDFTVVFILVLLMCASIAVIYSATNGTKYDGYHIRMARYYILGFVAFFGMSLLNYRFIVKYALYVYLFGIALLIIVMVAGREYYNATGWLSIGGFSFQPAELFKLVLTIALAALLLRKRKVKLQFWRDVVPLGMVTLVPFVMVMGQNDLGNALSYLVILAGILWVGNIKYIHALIAAVLIGGAVFGGIKAYVNYHDEAYAFMKSIHREHWLKRIDPWLMPDQANKDDAYQTRSGKLAIASGGMTGKGYLKGDGTQRVPLTYSDSIFVVIAEEFGFIGSSILLLLYFILIHRMILISLEAKERSGPYIIVGVVAMLLYQIFENIGMFIGLMPLTGITLPFISFGGTSILINMASLGLVMSIRLYGQEDDEQLEVAKTAAASHG
ncbi:cell cycle protein [Paenibacillus sp. CAA11]|uniref:FtsW/RodA/SpoVE family cell cycle protein n=1 Tax=Paenibacillus sp. CAA11 TaxID=1532905 RepID=UPI000D367FA5|nr:FtsW/RodA/SpoVE family cell cycle protein [Paenibacillus sp. CAA11]AWB46288.1 cell cycle protein [Paenibacillus sp. CAA11]